MKIGILTFHRAHNYGAILQCYALQEVLKAHGHQVEVIDYRQPHIEHVYKNFTFDDIKWLLVHPLKSYDFFFKKLPHRIRRKKIFDTFTSKYITLSKPCQGDMIPKDYDVYVIGSDQVWGKHCLGGKHDPIYFGEFSHRESSKIVAYAISTNDKSLEAIDSSGLSRSLYNFNSLSFRELQMSELVRTLFAANSHVDLDPTLLLTRGGWNFVTTYDWDNRKYVLVYYVERAYGEYAHNELLNKAKTVAAEIGAEVIDLSEMKYSVEDFVMSFKYAKCVITTSFHATVFSVIFNTPLYVVKLHDGHDGRYVNLLREIRLDTSVIELDDSVNAVPKVDYGQVNERLSALREPSLNYLIKSIG